MGICCIGSKSSYDRPYPRYEDTPSLPNPNPRNFKILRSAQLNDLLTIAIKYPDCTNYEGMKILIDENVGMADLVDQGHLDPHFSANKKFHSPIARFEPTPRGWEMARKFMEIYDPTS